MKSRTWFLITIALLIFILGATFFMSSARFHEPAQVFPATINRDCAPWDGTAFTVSIPYEPGTFINISIWQAPDLKLPVRFSFPDETMRVGTATFLVRYSYSIPLSGKVFFWQVERDSPVEGEFDLVTEAGQHLKGKLKAEWGNETVYCG